MCIARCEVDQHSPGNRSLSRRSLLGGLAGAAVVAGGAALAPPAMATDRRTPAAQPAGSGLELVLLGTRAGPPVNDFRAGISSALVVDGSVYVVDCGRAAVTQYVRAGLDFASLRGIFLTHLHADHIVDYYDFLLLGGSLNPGAGDAIPTGLPVYGPGRAGGLAPTFGGATSPTIDPEMPTPGTADLTSHLHSAFAYHSNISMRDAGLRDVRTLADVHDIPLPDVGASYQNTAPTMSPFLVMEDDKVRVTAVLVPHGPVFPSFAYRFDTAHGSVTFSGDTALTPNIPVLAAQTDVLVHEAINLAGFNGPPPLVSHLRESHVDVQVVGPVAEQAGARKLVLSHISDLAQDPIDVRQWRRWASSGYAGPVVVGEDLQRIRIR